MAENGVDNGVGTPGDPEAAALERRANELYWNSDESVNGIAEDLDLSKGALYERITPLPSGLPCPGCSTEMAFPNRTARDRGFLACPNCGLEEDEREVREEWKEASARRPSDRAVVVTPGDGSSARTPAPTQSAETRRIVAGVALLGMAAGILLGIWARKK